MGSTLPADLQQDRLSEFVERIAAFSKSDFGSSQANTRKKIIEPLLKRGLRRINT
jgi:hypothetical protein